ncbi:MAG: hypothetical protein LBQ47_04745 [Endomicrobium sp.]|nr:hypothetical protein [Endomicrobium sp.]
MNSKNNFAKDFDTIFKIKASQETSYENQNNLKQCYAPSDDRDITTTDTVEYISEKRES